MADIEDTDMAGVLARLDAVEKDTEDKDTVIADLLRQVARLEQDREEREAQDDPLGGATDDPFRRIPTVTVAGGGVSVPQYGDTQTLSAHQPQMQVGTCTGPLRYAAPRESFERRWGLTVWDEDDGCFYNEFDKATIVDGNVDILRLDCRESIVCAVDCTELVNPLCA